MTREYPLRTPRLDLRPHLPGDLEDLFAFHSRAEVVRYLPWPVRDREQVGVALEAKLGQGELRVIGEWLVLAMVVRATGVVIGEVLLKWASEQVGELGYALHDGYHGQGFAREATEAMLRIGFEELGWHRITATCATPNLASRRLLLRLGFRDEGRSRESWHLKGEWLDEFHFGILADEWRARPASG